jgi:thiamine biosynthesis lipoprotein
VREPALVTESRRTWAAMGTTCRVWLVGDGAAEGAVAAEEMVADLEARWSRFIASSDVGRLNSGEGRAVIVAPSTMDLVERAITWWRATEGRFDPTVLESLEAAGYDRDHALGHGPISEGAPAPGCAGIVVDHLAGTVQLPARVGVDLGGIGKGRAVDLVAEHLRELPGGLVDLGGDLRVWGTAPSGGSGWPIAVDDLRDGRTLALLGLLDGAVATSSTLRRRWSDGTRSAHHLIDPRAGSPVRGDLVSVTVVGGQAEGAEVLAKAALIAGSVAAARPLLEEHGVAAALVPPTGPITLVGGLADLCWSLPAEVA